MALILSKKSKSESAVLQPPKRKAEKGGKPAKKNGKKRFILLIGDEGAILIFMQGAKVLRRLFAPSASPSHSEAMCEIMKANPSVPITLLMDVIDQQYVPHTFPPVSSLSVGGLVKRRLDRDFQPEDLKGALQIGRDKTGRKEWKYLLVALAKTPLLGEWLDVILNLPNEMKGIYLVPVESEFYLSKLGKKLSAEKPKPWRLMLSHNKVSGFRQVVTHNGKLIFTRVSQAIDDAIPAVIAGNIEQEIINTMEYLKRLEFRDSAELEATVIVSQDVIELLDLRRFNFAKTSVLSPLSVSEALGLEQAALSADRFGDVVMAAAFAVSKKHALRFSNAYIDKLSKIYKAHLGLRVAAVLLCLLFVGLAVDSVITAVGSQEAITTAASKRTALQTKLTDSQRKVDGLTKDVAFKSAVVGAHDKYMSNTPDLESSLKNIVPFITAQQRIISMVWDLTGSEKGVAPASVAPAGGEKLPLNVKLEVDFSAAGNTIETLNVAAEAMRTAMQTNLKEYDVTFDPFPWLKEDGQTTKISLDQATDARNTIANAVVVVHLAGLKKVSNAVAAPSAPNPATNPAPGAP